MPEFRVVAERGRYVLGEEEDGYGIWDLEAGGEDPIERFPMTDDGFEEAWARLVRLDRQHRQPVMKVLTGGVVLGVIMWIVGSASSAFFLFEPFDGGSSLELVATVGTAGFRLAIGILLVLAAVLFRRKRPDTLPRYDRDGIDRALEGLLVIGLLVWIVSDLIVLSYRPNLSFPGTDGFQPPNTVQSVAFVSSTVGFDAWVAAVMFLALRWFRRWTTPAG